MSLKGVELQIAIPKTFEAGKLADHAQQQIHSNQALAHAALERQIERNRTAITASEETEHIHSDEEENGQSSNPQSERKTHAKSKKNSSKHPYKGNFVDYSG